MTRPLRSLEKTKIGRYTPDDLRVCVSFVQRDFECRDCRLKWDASSLAHIRTVSCSNCYSDNIILTSIHVEISDDWEVSGGVKPTEEGRTSGVGKSIPDREGR